ncbi:MAG: aminotransferase class I/II-fold pyridoxal phosphate-dependent enzyme [Candidatus Glassbacteria bacterium]|nr:aminotransferase class I/II-fold pyridoxal phosphate-dependent enzyme [Candidatus Glassbacteria bacterium]
MIDLRSDTVTRPSEPMRRAMYEAEVGDDVYAEDPTINRLQELTAQMSGREAALLVPTGSMGNAVCLDVLTSPGSEVVCDKLSHICNYELSSMAVFSGLTPRVIDGPQGCPTAAQVADAILPDIYYVAPTGCISVENTANIAGGRIYPLDRLREITKLAESKKIPVHMDGARIFNSAVATGKPVAELSAGVATVMFCLSKGLGAPVGSMIAGERAFIEEAWRSRKRMGGGMRQAGILAAAGIYALEHNVERLADDHANARRLAEALGGMEGLEVDLEQVETNIVMVCTAPPAPDAVELCGRLNAAGVRVDPLGKNLTRLVTHLDVSSEDISRAIDAFRASAGKA